MNDNSDEYNIHYLCAGPKNSSAPVILFEADEIHGLADFLIIQKLLVEQNRRSCIWDKPGLGFSEYLFTGFKSYQSFYHNLITSLNENPPYDFVGWGAGKLLLFYLVSIVFK